ncbi:MAG: hypothetical protein LUE93_15350 [Bacteroides sp.]|nr:hypothetical protein [Bacteroides sp.]
MNKILPLLCGTLFCWVYGVSGMSLHTSLDDKEIELQFQVEITHPETVVVMCDHVKNSSLESCEELMERLKEFSGLSDIETILPGGIGKAIFRFDGECIVMETDIPEPENIEGTRCSIHTSAWGVGNLQVELLFWSLFFPIKKRSCFSIESRIFFNTLFYLLFHSTLQRL